MEHKRILLPALALTLLLAVGAAVSVSGAALRPHHVRRQVAPRLLTPKKHLVNPRLTRSLRATTWRWQSILGRGRSRSAAPLHSPRALRFWRAHARRLMRLAARPPHKRQWLCIHRYEGSWGDDGDPYWGGLQMDRSFMRAYAPRTLLRRGWANQWTPLEQMWVAERAHRAGRGFYPWPNTARSCGLI
jgi:hypothetical protein